MYAFAINSHALAEAAAAVGIHTPEALVEHLGMPLEYPLTPLTMATILAHLPLSASDAFDLVGDVIEPAGIAA